jgi:hypothetical protein
MRELIAFLGFGLIEGCLCVLSHGPGQVEEKLSQKQQRMIYEYLWWTI